MSGSGPHEEMKRAEVVSRMKAMNRKVMGMSVGVGLGCGRSK
jgi:hypothetical protein